MNAEVQTPRSPYEKIGGLVFLGRTIDKLRLKAAGQLRPDFFKLMGDGYDARIMGYLHLDYAKFAEFVLSGASDEACWQYCVQNGRKLSELDVLIWNDFAAKRGWRDSVSGLLENFKAESGLAHRTDIQTFFEYWEVDEGRKGAHAGPGHEGLHRPDLGVGSDALFGSLARSSSSISSR